MQRNLRNSTQQPKIQRQRNIGPRTFNRSETIMGEWGKDRLHWIKMSENDVWVFETTQRKSRGGRNTGTPPMGGFRMLGFICQGMWVSFGGEVAEPT